MRLAGKFAIALIVAHDEDDVGPDRDLRVHENGQGDGKTKHQWATDPRQEIKEPSK